MDGYKATSLKNSFHKVRKVFFVLLPQVVIQKLVVSVFKDFEIDVVVNAICRREIDSLTPLLLIANLLADVCHAVQYSTWWVADVLQGP